MKLATRAAHVAAIFFLVLAAAAEAADRPRTCLVLSGGGARGAAHVGVLKVLEEYRVPIDCIVGTSMGALVGAAYATGTTTAEMERLMGELSTEALFKEKPPRQEQSVRRKQDDLKNLAGPELGLRDGEIFLQKGFVSGIQLETVLRRLSKAKGYRRFDELAIPFRAVATDLVTGRAVVFGEGELANVMRASMSVPGVIAPTEIGDMLLVDGGLTNNLPIDIAREMGAQVVIAVNLGTPLLKRKQLDSIVGVTGQMIFILTEQNVQASIALLRPSDVLIEPALGDYSFGDFDNMPKTVPIGEEAAHKAAGFLKRLSVSSADYAALRAKQLTAAPQDLAAVDEIRFENLKRVNPAYAATLMSTKPGEPIAQEVLDRDMRRLYGTGDFEHVGYRIVEEPGKRVLSVEAIEKSWGPSYLRLGLALASDFQGEAYFNILASYRRTWLNSLGAESRTEVQLGRTNTLMTEFYQPVDVAQHFFVAPRVEAGQEPVDVFEGDQRLARYNFTFLRAAIDAGIRFTRYGELRLGYLGGYTDARLSTGTGEFARGLERVKQGALVTRLFFDQLDSPNFPRNGVTAGVEVFASRRELGARDDYTRWQASALAARSFGDHTITGSMNFGGKTGADPLPTYHLFSSGGFLAQSGYRTGSLVGEKLQFAQLLYYRKIVKQTLLEGVYAGFSMEMGKMGAPLVPTNPTGWIKSGSLFVAVDSPIGPVYLGFGMAAGGIHSFYFTLGRP